MPSSHHKKQKTLAIVIPCFNEATNILPMYERVIQTLNKLHIDAYEIIYIDNGSNDNSEEIFKKLVKKDAHITVLVYSRNFGPHGAYAGGLAQTNADAVVCIDGDLQDPPELIGQMVAFWKKGYEVVYGIRQHRKGSLLRKLFTIAYYRILNKVSYIKIPLDAGDFALMDRKVVAKINALPEKNKYFTGLRAWVGFRQIGIPFDRMERFSGKTKFNMIDYFRWAIQSIFSFSHRPLELISYLAILVVFLALIGMFIYMLDFFFYPNNPRGFITLIMVTLFLGAVQLLCLSIIGQYLATIFDDIKKRPEYIIKEVLKK